MNAANPLVSVILPAYNVEKYLPETIASLQEQSLESMEIVIVEDGSTDGTKQIVEKAAEIPNVRAIYHEGNKGVAAARNTGIAAARGEFIAFVDGDDVTLPDMYLKMVTKAQEEKAEVVTCGYSTFKGDDDPAPAPHRIPVGQLFAGKEKESVLARAHRDKMYWYNQLTMYHRDLIARENLRFDPEVLMGQDSVFNAQAFHKARSLYALPERLYLIRQRPGSQTSHGNPDWNRRLHVQYRALRRFYEAESLWETVSGDYYRNVLEFSLLQAILNSSHMATDRTQFVELLRDLRRWDWVTDALEQRDIWRGLPLKRALVSRLMKYRMFRLVSLIYPPKGTAVSSTASSQTRAQNATTPR